MNALKKIIVGVIVCLLCTQNVYSFDFLKSKSVKPKENVESSEEFLDLVQYKIVQFFLNEVDPETGLVKDRANNFEQDNYAVASIASVGFALPAYVIAKERKWLSEKEAYSRVRKTLLYFRDSLEHKEGFYYHFVHMHTGARQGDSEISSIDTALFLAGVLFVRQYYAGTEIEEIATQLYERVNWSWMLDNDKTFNMGWSPSKTGISFLQNRWEHYDESMILYILGIGAPQHAVPATVWDNIDRTVGRYGDNVLIQSPPLFTHQYTHAFVDFRNKHDAYADYFVNSVAATFANREFCLDNAQKYDTYSDHVWGLTACDGPNGYKAYGAKPGHANHDGTVAPTAAGGSIVFTPDLSIKALRYMYEAYNDKIWGRYGFIDSFNLEKDWYATDVIGIDQGIMLLMIENYRTELIWTYFMRNPEVQNALKSIGFEQGTLKAEMPSAVELNAYRREKNIFIDGDPSEWEGVEAFNIIPPKYLEFGEVKDLKDFSASLKFLWDDDYFYFCARVEDDIVSTRKQGNEIYKNDCLEFFFDPDNDGLVWNNAKDIQVGISPRFYDDASEVNSYAWFQETDPMEYKNLYAATEKTETGYVLEGAIRWSFIGFTPSKKAFLRMSPAFNDVDHNDKSEAKVNVFFQDITGKDDLKELARVVFRGETI